jgi:hypothetical protein
LAQPLSPPGAAATHGATMNAIAATVAASSPERRYAFFALMSIFPYQISLMAAGGHLPNGYPVGLRVSRLHQAQIGTVSLVPCHAAGHLP